MSSQQAPSIKIEITLKADRPELLTGLEAWLNLGLLNDAQIRRLCRQSLICAVPEPNVVPVLSPIPQPVPETVAPPVPVTPPKPSVLNQILQSFMAEFSVRWLLFLGVFLVVVSSGVLAASQWERFPAAMQYGVLWGYTIIFWAISLWADKQANLRLTAQTLRLATLLLVPVNFWAMDSFGLWQFPLNWVVIAIATLSLIAITIKLFGQQRLPLFTHLGLSVLHWGWILPQWPIVAVYAGVIGTAFSTISQVRLSPPNAAESDLNSSHFLPIKKAFLVVYALLILLGRALFVTQVDIRYLGLALAICGALLAWLDRQPQSEHKLPSLTRWNWEVVGGLLIGLGWIVTVWDMPAQALAVSGLALWLFGSRVLAYEKRRDVFMLFIMGLQAIFLAWRIVPAFLQQGIVSFLTQITHSTDTPEALWGVVLLPYLALTVQGCAALDRRNATRLVNFGENLALIFGILLTLISSLSSSLQAINLLGSTLIFYGVTQRYLATPSTPQRQHRGNTLVYLTHITGLLGVASGMNAIFPSLTLGVWLVVFLGLMLVEFAFSLTGWGIWHKSAWHMGLGLAGLSYLQASQLCGDGVASGMCLAWWVTPIALTGVASLAGLPRFQLATQYSTIAVIVAQLLTIEEPRLRLVSLGLGFALMLVNTQYLQQLYAGAIAVGLGLGWLTAVLSQGFLGFPANSISAWLVAMALTLTSLWLLYAVLAQGYQKSRRIPRSLYAIVVDGWAIALCPSLLTLLIILPVQSLAGAIAATLTMLIAAYRSWQLPRTPLALNLSILVFAVAQISLFPLPITRISGLAVATLLIFIQTRYLRNTITATIAVGFSLGFVAALFWEAPFIVQWDWAIVGAIATLILGLIHKQLSRQTSPLKQAYAKATQIWHIALAIAILAAITLHSLGLYGGLDDFAIAFSPTWAVAIALVILIVSIAVCNWQTLNPWSIYSLGWGLELLAAEALSFTDSSILALSIANIILGLLIQWLGNAWHHRNPDNQVFPSLHILPLLYGILGVCLRWGSITAWTGLTSLGIALIFIGIGRRRAEFKPLVYLGLVGISVAAYEMLLYQLLQQPGGALGDGFIAIAALGTTLLYIYRILSPWLGQILTLTPTELKITTHCHWAWSSLVLIAASFYPLQATLLLGFGTGAFLVQYAIFQGRNHPQPKWGEAWVYVGFLEALALRIYWLSTPIARLLAGPLVSWKVAIASIFAYFLYILPWQQWGWSKRPWILAAFAIPLIGILEIPNSFYPLSLLIAAIFYLFLAWDNQQVRFTYISAGILLWVVWRYFESLNFTHAIWYIAPLGLGILYIAQVDPTLQQSTYKNQRHFIRLFGISLICLTALFTQPGEGLVPGILSLAAIFAGLGLRIRAFLVVGTATFILHILYQLVILVFDYSFTKWIVGLGVGICLIWIAYNFETRRERIHQFVQHWVAQLQDWE